MVNSKVVCRHTTNRENKYSINIRWLKIPTHDTKFNSYV